MCTDAASFPCLLVIRIYANQKFERDKLRCVAEPGDTSSSLTSDCQSRKSLVCVGAASHQLSLDCTCWIEQRIVPAGNRDAAKQSNVFPRLG